MIEVTEHTGDVYVSVFHAYYDGIYHFVAAAGDAVSFKLNGTGFQLSFIEHDLVTPARQRYGSVWMSAGDELYHTGAACSLYGYRVSDELS